MEATEEGFKLNQLEQRTADQSTLKFVLGTVKTCQTCKSVHLGECIVHCGRSTVASCYIHVASGGAVAGYVALQHQQPDTSWVGMR